MSVQKTTIIQKGITGEICRINRVTVVSKPASVAKAIVDYAWYADNEEKDANRPLYEGSLDLPVTNFIGTQNAIAQAYTELKAEGQMLNGGVDC